MVLRLENTLSDFSVCLPSTSISRHSVFILLEPRPIRTARQHCKELIVAYVAYGFTTQDFIPT
jgi:hypothetical protein